MGEDRRGDGQSRAVLPGLLRAGGALAQRHARLRPAGALAAINWSTLPNYGAPPAGLLLTALVWAPLNAAMEQL
ncbi:MAG TPA: hypothetical protein VF897_09690 [Roseiflexaceae bacterium]